MAALGLHCTVGFLPVVLHELLIVLSLLLWSMSSRASGFRHCSTWTQ